MAGDYLIEILATLRDEASGKIRDLQRAVDELKASAAAGDATGDLRQGLADTADEADRAAQAHKDLSRQQQEGSRASRQSESDVKNLARWQEQAAEETTGHAESTQELRRQQDLMSRESGKHEATVKRVSTIHEGAADSVASHAESHSELVGQLKNADDAMKRVQAGEKALGQESENLTTKVDKALSSFDELSTSFKSGSGDLKELRQDLTASGRELDALSRRFKTFSDEARTLRDVAEEAKSMAKSLGTLQEESRQPVLNSLTEELQRHKERAAAERESAQIAKELNLQTEKAKKETSKRVADAEIDDARRVTQARQQSRSIESAVGSATSRAYTLANPNINQTQQLRAARQLEQSRARLIQAGLSPDQAHASIGRVSTQALSDFGFGSQSERDAAQVERAHAQALRMATTLAPKQPRDFAAEGNDLVGRMKQLDQAAQSHTASNAELTAGYSRIASGLRRVTNEMAVGSSEARKFGDAMEEAGKKAKNTDLARSSSGFGQFVQNVSHATDQIGIKVISLSAALRGLRLVGVVGLFQPLVTGLLSLAGSFTSVASGAGQAAATIGGVFLSGLGQLIPMASIGIASLIRLRDIFQAVQAAQAAKQENFFQPFQGLITHLQNTSQLIESEQQLTNSYYALKDAQVQVRESQIQLTQARIDAIRNLQDLVIAEKSAQLQLKQANLSVTQAEQQLSAAQASGSQMAIQQAQLQVQGARISQQQAQLGVPRARQNLSLAQGYGVAGAPGVLSANEAYRQSLLGVVQAQQQVGNAQRQMQITQLQLKQPSSQMTQQQATLQYLLSQMSAPEKALFSVINNIENQLRSPNSPLKKITDYIIQPFVGAFQKLDALLTNNSFMQPITKLAATMGTAIKSIFGTMFGGRGTSFFETMAKDATASIPVVTKAITGLMKVFEDIATAAAPAFKTLSQDWANFWNAMDARDRTPQGQKRLTEFFNQGAKWAEDFAHLAGAVFGLFKALGHDAAPQGMKTVTSFTEAIHDATAWVQTHGPEVTRFFSESRQGLSLIGGVLFTIGKSLLQVFSLTSLSAFAGLLNTLVIPAARDFANIVGFLVRKFMELVNAIGPLKPILEAVIAGYFGLAAFGKIVGAVTRVTDAVHGAKDAVMAFKAASGFSRISAAWDALTSRILKGKSAIKEASAATDELRDKTVADDATEAAANQGVDATLAEEDALLAGRSPGGVILPRGVGGAGGAAAKGAGGGFLSGLGATALRFGGPLLGLAGLTVGGSLLLDQTRPKGVTTKGDLAALLGNVGGAANHGNFIDNAAYQVAGLVGIGGTPSGQSPLTSRSLQQLQNGLRGVTDPAQLGAQKLQDLYSQANKILSMPDITAKQRAGLQQLQTILNPVDVAIARSGHAWEATFSGLNVTTQSVMKQLTQVLNQDQQIISSNFVQGTKGWATQVLGLTATAFDQIQTMAALGVKGVGAAMQQLNKMLVNALHALGVSATPSLISGALSGGQAGYTNLISYATSLSSAGTQGVSSQGASGIGHRYATGGWHQARPGGEVAHVAEGGHDEVTLTTDPRHAPRQRALLGQYMQRMSPHMATGGYVYPIPGFTLGRTDMGIDANAPAGTPIGAIGDSKLVGVIPNWYAGQPLLDFQLLDGPDSGRFWYVAEQITPVTEAIGSIFKAGQMVARYASSGTGIEIGWAGDASGTTLAQSTGQTGDSSHGNAPAGVAFRSFLAGLSHGQIVGGGGGIGQMIQQLVAPKVPGVKGTLGTITQGVVNLATKAANSYLTRVGGTASGSNTTPSGPAHPGTAQERAIVAAAAAKYGIDPHFLWGVFGTETSFGADLSTSSTGAQGYFQFEPASAKAYGVDPFNFTSAAYGAAHLLSTGKAGGDLGMVRVFYGAPSQTYLDNVMKFGATFAGGGLLGSHLRRIGLRHLRRHLLRFADGGRAPWGGEPIPIIAHEGERVVNPGQWGEVAAMTGMTPQGLDHHLGYDTGHPRQSFAPGGIPTLLSSWPQPVSSTGTGRGGNQQSMLAQLAATLMPGGGRTILPGLQTLSKIFSFLTSVSSDIFKFDPGSVFGSFKVLTHVFTSITDAFTKIGSLPLQSQLDKIGTLIENFADPNNPASTLNLLSAAFQRFQVNLAVWATRYAIGTVQDTSIARLGKRGGYKGGTGFGGVSLPGNLLGSKFIPGVGNVDAANGRIGGTQQTELDALSVRSSVEQTNYLRRESKAVKKMIDGVKHRIKMVEHSNLSSSAKNSALGKLKNAYTDLTLQQENLNNAISQQIGTTFQNEQQYIQDTLMQVNNVFQTQQQQIQAVQSTAQAKGQYGRLPQIDQAIINSAKAQIQALQKPLKEARKSHNSELVAQIQQQISQLQQTIGSTTAQMLQDAMSAVQQKAQTSQSKVSMLQGIAQTLSQSTSTQGGFQFAGAINAQALQLNQASLQSQVKSYNTLLAKALNTGNQGAAATLTQTIDQLTAQLVQNQQALADNTAQMISQESQFTQSRGQFKTGTLGGLAQVISTIGQTTGFTNVPLLKTLTQGQNTVLGSTQSSLLGQLGQLGGGASGLASLLGRAGTPLAFVQALSGANLSGIEAGQSQTWINTFESLVNNLTQNTEAIATNNQQLAQLNGQLLQPQQWSSTAWSAFRTAIFSGMGNLLPQFQSSLPPGAMPTIAPVFSGVGGGGGHSPTIGNLHINHAPTSSVSPPILGQQLAYEVSNAMS